MLLNELENGIRWRVIEYRTQAQKIIEIFMKNRKEKSEKLT